MKDTFVVNIDRGLDTDTGHVGCFEKIEGDATLMPWKSWLEKGWIVAEEPDAPAQKKKSGAAVPAPGGDEK